MVVIHDKHRVRDEDITLYVNAVRGGDLTAWAYEGAVIYHDCGVNPCYRRATNVEPRILADADRITKTDCSRHWPVQTTGVVDGEVGASGRERVS
jgi:hypothetical protein